MKKKAGLCVVFLLAVGAAVSAMEFYNGWYITCKYWTNGSSEVLYEWFTIQERMTEQKNPNSTSRISKLPNSVFQAIDHALEDYSLDVGDIFDISFLNSSMTGGYNVALRITNRNGAYEWYAYFVGV